MYKCVVLLLTLIFAGREALAASMPPAPTIPPVPGTQNIPSIKIQEGGLDVDHTMLEVYTVPSGANVYLGGQMIGQTPLRQIVHAGSSVPLQITKNGYYMFSAPVLLRGGKRFRIVSPLDKMPEIHPYAP